MATTEQDFQSLGLTTDDWRAIVFGTGTIPPHRLDAARAAIAKIGHYGPKLSSDTEVLDGALRLIATQFAYLWLKGPLSQEEKTKFLQVRNNWSRERAEEHLAELKTDQEWLDKLRQP